MYTIIDYTRSLAIDSNYGDLKEFTVSSEQLNEQDILYVVASDKRKKIMQYLSSRPRDYVKSTELAEAINEKLGTLNFHCKGLEQYGLVDYQLVVQKRHVRVTDKGARVIKEIDKRQQGGRK